MIKIFFIWFVLLLSPLIVVSGECNFSPTAKITTTPVSGSSPDFVFRDGTEVVFSGATSTANNCNGSITEYRWKIEGVYYYGSTKTYTFPALGANEHKKTYSVELRVRNDASPNLYNTKTITVTVKRPQRIYHLKDHLGNVRTSVDTEGNVVGYDDYYPFGLVMPERSNNTSNPNDNYKFTGHERDDEAGLTIDYMMARSYDPVIGRFLQIDPMASARSWVSPYNYVQNNPVNAIDPDGALDWVLNGDNEIYWDDNANSQATTQAGETYLGKELTFTFNSNIDGGLWDGPGGSAPVGDKLTSTVTLSASENSDGQLTGITATKDIKVGSTPIGTARGYFPGLGSDQNKFSTSQSTNANGILSSFSLNFEQHASVSPIEGFGLNMMGFDIVNVAQQMNVSTSGSQLSISTGTDVFPSASLSVNGTQLFKYNQPSFRTTHGRNSTFIDNNRGGVDIRTTSRRPAPQFYNRYKK